MESLIRMLHYIQQGEFWIFPLLIVMALGFAIATERYVYLTITRVRNRGMLDKILGLLNKDDIQQAYAASSKSDIAIGKMVSYGLARYKSSHTRDDVEMAMEESMMEIIPRLEKRTQYVATFANVATLLGLLGTVMGLIG
ncbi:MAG: MotA/TolQ/ExbB proton channel family protein, partial [Gammaproteobacteria bacterium]|nr:MotA/TolQ/ExbB proton channel family protein [Gammaproteobacteria bacterium]